MAPLWEGKVPAEARRARAGGQDPERHTERRPAPGSGSPGQARCAAELGVTARGAVRGAERSYVLDLPRGSI